MLVKLTPEKNINGSVFCVRYCQEIQDFKIEAAKNKQILQAQKLLNRNLIISQRLKQFERIKVSGLRVQKDILQSINNTE